MSLLRRRERPAPGSDGANPPFLLIGALSIVAVIVVAGMILSGTGLPFGGSSRTLSGVFTEVRGLRAGAPVRVAGVAVGRVDDVTLRDDGRALVRLRLDDDAPALRSGTHLRIRPRVFLEGGYAVQIEPGPPGGAKLASGATIPVGQTAVSVPLPAVAGTLNAPTRQGLKTTVAELNSALGRSGSAKPLARALPDVLRDTARLTRAARGEKPGDLRTLLRAAASTTEALTADRGALSGTVTGLRRTTEAVGSEETALRDVLRELPRIADRAPAALRAVREARPQVDGLLQDLDPALRTAPAALEAANGTLTQARALSAPAELPALLRSARPLVRELVPASDDAVAVLEQATPLLKCLRDKLVPGFAKKVDDGALTSGTTVLQELLALSTGLTSGGATFDANGWLVRLGATVGPRVVTGDASSGVGPFAASTEGAIGARPAWYGTNGLPPFRPDAVCADQPLPDLKAAARAVPTTRATGPAPTADPPQDDVDIKELRRKLDRWLGDDPSSGGTP